MKRWLPWVLIGIILAGLLFMTCIWLPTYSYMEAVNSGGVPEYFGQDQRDWCGAACIEMYQYFKTWINRSQQDIMDIADTDYPWGMLDDAEICAYLNGQIESHSYADYQRYWANFLADTKKLISMNEPIICGVNSSRTIAHWVLLIGYRVPFGEYGASIEGILFADPASPCSLSNNWRCFGTTYDFSIRDFNLMTGNYVIYIARMFSNLAKESSAGNKVIDSPKQPLEERQPEVYANYSGNGTAKMSPESGPGPGNENIPFADGSNGIADTMNERIMRAADSIVATWGTEQLKDVAPASSGQFEGAFATQPEKVTNMPKTNDVPGGDYYFVPYLDRSGSFYVGAVKLTYENKAFIGHGIVGLVIQGGSVAPGSPAKVTNIHEKILVTRKVLHSVYPDCKFFPFWDNNEVTGVPMLPFWYIQRPDGSRFILSPWGQEMVRDAQNGVLLLKGSGQTKQGSIPNKMLLSQNYPNPFNPETQINFAVPNFAPVKIEIFNVLGQRIKTLVNGEYQAGNYRVTWDGTNQNGEKVSSGIYLYRLQVGAETVSKKMILTK